MPWPMLIIDFVAVWIAATLLLDTRGRGRRSLVERLEPYIQRDVGDDAQAWLRGQRSDPAS